NDFNYLIAKLELTCAGKVLNIWDYCDFTDNSARDFLALIERFVKGEVEEKKLKKRTDFFYTNINQTSYEKISL
ncbi:Imm5 family immunity protein, partial [Okeania sp.]|uniref:Imm5 family immunity protein n=1 Tax=Okeania sp. TaxID=3100323 RepID=UPI002B4B2C63